MLRPYSFFGLELGRVTRRRCHSIIGDGQSDGWLEVVARRLATGCGDMPVRSCRMASSRAAWDMPRDSSVADEFAVVDILLGT